VPFAELTEAGKEADVWARWDVETVALTPEADAAPLDAVVGRAGRRIAVLLGSEERGLDRATLEAATWRARIPMAPTMDSLNVAAAGAIALYAVRRRWARPPGGGR
jgi:tRNA G18 (ribose-2'-O)-methylase SpoU